MKLADIDIFYRTVLHRAVDEVAKAHLLNVDVDAVALVRDLIRSDEFFQKWLLDNHSMLIHEARLAAVQTLIPPGRKILDLGGLTRRCIAWVTHMRSSELSWSISRKTRAMKCMQTSS